MAWTFPKECGRWLKQTIPRNDDHRDWPGMDELDVTQIYSFSSFQHDDDSLNDKKRWQNRNFNQCIKNTYTQLYTVKRITINIFNKISTLFKFFLNVTPACFLTNKYLGVFCNNLLLRKTDNFFSFSKIVVQHYHKYRFFLTSKGNI